MLTGLSITGLIYVLVAISAVAIVPVGELAEAEATALLRVVETGAPGIPIDEIFPFIAMFAVANTALINMLMASRLLYGMAKEDVLARPLARVHAARRTPYVSIVFTTLISYGLIVAVTRFVDASAVATLGGTTALLLLAVFTLVHIAVLVLRRKPIDRAHFRAPTIVPVIGMIACAFFVGPWTGRDSAQYAVALGLLAVGIVLWAITWAYNRGVRAKKTGFRHPEQIGG
jgi:APA family basic amino acid/polyamine antiporter